MGGNVIETVRPGVRFTPPAAASFRRLEARLGRQADVNSTYRDWDVQLRMYNAWQAWISGRGPKPDHSRALHPSQSVHCQGLAWDSDDWRTPGFISLAAEYGWIRTAAGDPTEQHHFEYQWQRDWHRNDPAPTTTTPAPKPVPKRRIRPMLEAAYRTTGGTLAGQARLGGAVTVFTDINEWTGIALASGMAAHAVSDEYLIELLGRCGQVPAGLYDDGRQPLLILALKGTTSRYGSLGLEPGRAWELTSTVALAALQRAGAKVVEVDRPTLDAALVWSTF